MKKKTSIIVILVLIIIFGVYIANRMLISDEKDINNSQKSLEKVRVQAGWLLNGEFANICASILNGYYEEEGMEVELIPGGPSGASFTIATNAVAQDPTLTLGVDGDVVPLVRGVAKESEQEKLRVKAFAAFWNDNPYGFIVKKESGLNSIKDFAKTKSDGTKYKIGVTADSVIQYAIADYLEISVSDLEIVIVGFDATPFLTGQVDALAGYWTTQAYEVEKAGIEYSFLSSSEIPGFKQPSMVAIASEKNLKEKKDLLTRWLRATIKGSEFIIKNPEIAGKYILDNKCGGPNFDLDQEIWLVKKSLPLFDKNKIGWIYKDQVTNFADAYYKLDQISKIPAESELIDYSILENIYK